MPCFSTRTALASGLLLSLGLAQTAAAQVVVTPSDEDAVIRDHLCLGDACASNPGADLVDPIASSLLIVDTRTRIDTIDTSDDANYPGDDWSILFNDAPLRSSGGIDRFSIVNRTEGSTPFQIEGDAPSNAIYVEDSGEIGLGTTIPLTNVHIFDSGNPGIRIESVSGERPDWLMNVGSDGLAFFDMDGGPQVPMLIENGAPNHSLRVENTGDVGIGIEDPTAALHVRRTDSTAQLLVEDTDFSGPQQMVVMRNNGAVQWVMENSKNGAQWMLSSGQSLLMAPSTDAADAVYAFGPTGDLTIDGVLTEMSDKHSKMAVEPVEPAEILAKLADLPISEWTYKHDAENGIRHIGPMAQDFHAAFGTGADPRGLSSLDSTGVALAAIQALAADVAAQRALNTRLMERLERLERRLP